VIWKEAKKAEEAREHRTYSGCKFGTVERWFSVNANLKLPDNLVLLTSVTTNITFEIFLGVDDIGATRNLTLPRCSFFKFKIALKLKIC
jgi:hypothetical protein